MILGKEANSFKFVRYYTNIIDTDYYFFTYNPSFSYSMNLCDEEGYRLIPIFIIKKPKSTIAVIKENVSNEEFLQIILGKEDITWSDNFFKYFGRGACRSYKHSIESWFFLQSNYWAIL